MSTFRDAIADAVAAEGYDQPDWSADAILATPEMQAIRSALYHSALNAGRRAYPQSPWVTRPKPTTADADSLVTTYLRENCQLTQSAIDWVVDE